VAENTDQLRAADLITAIKSAGIRFIVALPDRTTSEHLLKPMLADPELRVVQVCKEDEGVSICSGLYAAGQRALLLMQHTGLLDSSNALRGVAVEGHNSIPRNLVHGLCQNGTYETNGAVAIPGRGQVSFAGLAREAGYPQTYRFDTLTPRSRNSVDCDRTSITRVGLRSVSRSLSSNCGVPHTTTTSGYT